MSTSNSAGIADIEALREQWPTLFNAGNISALGDLFYATDAYALPGGLDFIHGRDAIVSFLTEVRQSGPGVKFELGVIHTEASGDTGYLVGNYVFTDADGVDHRGLTHEAYQLQSDGRWQCVVDMWHNIDD